METKKPISTENILACESRLLEAMKVSDVKILDQLLHDDLLFITPDGQTISKEMDLQAHRSGNMVINKIKTDIEKIAMIADTAVVTLLMDTEGTMLNRPIEGKFRYIRVWKVCGDHWKVIAGSCTKV